MASVAKRRPVEADLFTCDEILEQRLWSALRRYAPDLPWETRKIAVARAASYLVRYVQFNRTSGG